MEQTRALPRPQEAVAYLQICHFILRKIEQQGMIVPYRTIGVHPRQGLEMPCVHREASRILF
jgi:hypothetical protein